MTDEEIQALQVALDSSRAQARELETELETLKAEKGTLATELETRNAAITELEQTLSERDTETNALKLALEESNVIASEAKQSLANAVVTYKAVVVQANPNIPGELITGDTIDAIAQSLKSARTIVGKVRESVKAEIASFSVPAGAPARAAPDLESLSPREKIQYAITKGGK